MVRVVGGGGGEGLLTAFELFLQFGDTALFPEIIQQRDGFKLYQVLGEVADRHPFPVGDLDCPAVEIDAPEDRPQHRRLAGAVVADEADPAAVGDRPVDLLEDLPVGERKADVPKINQGS